MRSTFATTVFGTFACVLALTLSVNATDSAYNGVHHRHGVGHGVVSHHGYGGNQGYGGGASVGHHVGRYSEERSVHAAAKGNDYQKDSKYYYGGQYKGTCQGDGLYYKDDTTFVMCSNGYSHQQPCPPGTKTSGSPSYKAGYYYGYTDLCSVNLVDYGLGPEHYAPVGFSQVATKDAATKEVVHQHGRGGQGGGEFFAAEKEVVTSYDQRPLGHHGNRHSQHVVKEKGYSGSEGSSFVKKETEQKDATYPGAYGSGYPTGYLGSSGTSYASLSHHSGAGYPSRDAAYPHRPYPAAVNAHGHRSTHGAYSGGINSQGAYSKDTSYSSSAETAVGAGGYPTLNAFATKSNTVYSSAGQGGAVGVVRGALSAVSGERSNYGYPQHGAGEYASARAYHSL